MATGAFVLAIAAVFATKANKKFTTFTTVVFGSSHQFIITNGSTGFPGLSTVKSTGFHTAFAALYTALGVRASGTLATKGTSHHALYY